MAPIAIFVYNRPEHTKKMLEALSQNDGISDTDLYFFLDGPKRLAAQEQVENIQQVKACIDKVDWAKSVSIETRETNVGLAQSIVYGISRVLEKHEKVIVLEDDVITASGFVKYMNDALELYRYDEKVMHVSAYLPPIKHAIQNDTFFFNVTHCWGWGTWRRAWRHYTDDVALLKSAVLQKDPGLALYNFNGYGDYWNQLRSNEMGTICTWAVKWYSVVFLNDGLCLHPQKSLTKNIGADGSGTHFKSYNATLTNQSITPQVAVQKIELKEKEEHRMMFLAYYKESIKKESGLDKIFARMLNPIKKRLKNRFSHFFDKEASELHRIQKLPTNRIFTTTIFGNPITVQSAVGFRFLYKELFESNLYKFKSDTDKPRIIDCGANIGVSIIYFKKLFPQSTIIAFEADPYINQICNDNIRSLNLQNVTLHNFALWDEDGETFFETNSNDAGRVVGKEGEKAAVISVKTRRLSHFLEEKTDFLKIDIEGAETKVLTECNYLLKNVKALFIKYHAFKNQEDTLPEILGILKQNNFDYFISTPYVINRTPLESQRFDGALRSLVNIHAIQKGVL